MFGEIPSDLSKFPQDDYMWLARHIRCAPTYGWLQNDPVRGMDAYGYVKGRQPWTHHYPISKVITYYKLEPSLSKEFLDLYNKLPPSKSSNAEYLVQLSRQFR